jgi:hypothetical protein
LRDPESCKSDRPNSVLINLNEHVGSHAEVKCLSINPLRPELLAVGANDPYVRLYDRRMLHRRRITFPPDMSARSVKTSSFSKYFFLANFCAMCIQYVGSFTDSLFKSCAFDQC